MISVITAVHKKDVFETFKQNLKATTGIPYELIGIENSNGAMGLCEVYNKGAARARYDIVCFAHEDILIRTRQWGPMVIGMFDEHAKLGLLGVAGSNYKPAMPSGWSYPTADASTMYMNIVEGRAGKPVEPQVAYNHPGNRKLPAVVCIDGLWFCTRKAVALEIKFDEALFKRFHCYDVDFSLAVYQKYQVAVTFDILVEHFSAGSFNAEWVHETLKLHKKWKKHLPVNRAALDAATQKSQELGAFYFFLPRFIASKLPVYSLLSLLWSQKILSAVGFKTFIKLHLELLRYKLAETPE